jgi:hypothetical protein
MDSLSSFIDRYVAVWNERDPEVRRRRIAAVWAPNGTTCYRLLDARGYEAIESRVTGSWDRWLREGKFFFRAARGVSHHQAIKLGFAMLATDNGKVEANGLAYLLLDKDGRIVHDYQFNPSVHDTPDLAAKYLACRDETDAARRRSLTAELWAENGALFREDTEAQGLDEVANTIESAHRSLLATNLVVPAADRSQHHHNVAHIAWRAAPRDGRPPISTTTALLIFNVEGRIGAAYEFNEPKAGDAIRLFGSLHDALFSAGFRENPHGGNHEDGDDHDKGREVVADRRSAPIGEDRRDDQHDGGEDGFDVARHGSARSKS